MRSIVPALKFSATMSNLGTNARKSSRPSGDLRSSPTLRLSRLFRRYVAPTIRPSGSTIPGEEPRPDSPCTGCSTFTTSAPSRASSWVAYGQRLHLLRREHPHAVERLAVGPRVFVHHVAESHGGSL